MSIFVILVVGERIFLFLSHYIPIKKIGYSAICWNGKGRCRVKGLRRMEVWNILWKLGKRLLTWETDRPKCSETLQSNPLMDLGVKGLLNSRMNHSLLGYPFSKPQEDSSYLKSYLGFAYFYESCSSKIMIIKINGKL